MKRRLFFSKKSIPHRVRDSGPLLELARFPMSHRKTVAVVYALVVIALSLGIKDVRFENRFGKDLPEDDPIRQTNRRFEEVFGERDLLMAALVSDGGIYNARTMSKVLAISRELERIDEVVTGSVKSVCTVKNISADGLSLEIAPFCEEVPADEEAISNIRENVRENFMARGRLVSVDESATVFRADLAPDHDVDRVYRQARAVADAYSGPEDFYLTGDTVVDYEVTSSMRRDIAFLFPVSLLLATAILLVAFGRLGSVLAVSAAVVATTAATLGLMGFLSMPVTVVGIILPVTIVAVVSAYGIHLVNAYNNERQTGHKREDAIRQAMTSVGGPVAISAVTSAIGFGSLIIFKIRSIHDFGLVLACAILFGVLSALILVPSILEVFPSRRSPAKTARRTGLADRFMLRFYGYVERYRRLFVAGVVVGFIVAIAVSFRLRVGLQPAKFFPEGHPTRQSLDVFDDKLGGSTYFNVMIETGEPDGILEPEVLAKMDRFQRFAEAQEHVGYTTSFVDVVKRLHTVLGEDDGTSGELPTDKFQIAQYLLLYSISGDPTDFEEIVDYDYRRAKLVIMLNTYDDAEHLELYETLRQEASELFGDTAAIEFGGRAMILLAQDRYIVVGKLLNIACSLVIVWFVCTLYFRSISGGLLSVIPLIVSTIYTFGLMGLTGIRLNVATAMTTGIAVGVGVDFAVHYIHRFREEFLRTGDDRQAVRNTLLTAGKGIIFNAASVSCGFLVFLGSRFQALNDFGWLIALTMVTCAAGTLLFLPPLICVVRPYFIYGREPMYISKALSSPPVRIPILNLQLDSRVQVQIESGLRKISQFL